MAPSLQDAARSPRALFLGNAPLGNIGSRCSQKISALLFY
jgi:hypothetical protein